MTRRAAPPPPSGTAKVSPVTDAMLAKPPADDWLMWRGTLNSWGYSPLKQITTAQWRPAAAGVDAAAAGRSAGRHAAGARRRAVFPRTRATSSRPSMPPPAKSSGSIAARSPRTSSKYINAAVHQPQPRHLRQPDHRHLGRWRDLCASMRAPARMCGPRRCSTTQRGIHQTSGPIVADGKVFSGRGCEPIATAGPDDCVITAHDALTGKELWRRRTIPGPGEPGDETWGDVPLRRAQARRHVDAAQLRPGTEAALYRHVGDLTGAEVPARRQRQEAPVPQLHAGHRSGDRQDRLVLPAPDRQLGHGPSLRAHPASTPKSRRTRSKWPGSIPTSSRARPTRCSPAFPARPASSTRSIGAPASSCGRGPPCTRTWCRRIDGKTGAVHADSPTTQFSKKGDKGLVCPNANGGKNWPAGAYSPLTKTHVLPAAEHLRDGGGRHRIAQRALAPMASRSSAEPTPGTTNIGTIHAISTVTGKTRLEVRAARRNDVAGHHRRRPAVRRRCGRALPRLRPEDRQGAVGSEPRLAGQRLSGELRREWPAVHRGEHRAGREHRRPADAHPEIHVGNSNALYVFALPEGAEGGRAQRVRLTTSPTTFTAAAGRR